jgi:carbon-monoxide dehydrogenase medium subunit
MKRFSYIEPASVDEVLQALAAGHENARLVAGGTALISFMKNDLVEASVLIGLRRIAPHLSVTSAGELRVGATTTLYALEKSDLAAQHAPLLAEACSHVATTRIRGMATLGGALAYADPALDTPPALLASDARVVIRSASVSREVDLNGFFLGIYETDIRPWEMISEIVVPPQPVGAGSAFLKYLPGTQDDYPTVSVAIRIVAQRGSISDVRIALGAVGHVPVRAMAAERTLIGVAIDHENLRRAANAAAQEIDPLTDIRGSAEYKRKMAEVHVLRGLRLALERCAHLTPENRTR